jgi:hypothetical protein
MSTNFTATTPILAFMVPPSHDRIVIGYEFRPLEAAMVDRAFPLMREVSLARSLERWRHYARSVIDGGDWAVLACGIDVVEVPSGYVRALFGYTAGPDPLHGRCLRIDYLAALNTFDRALIGKALMGSFDRLAETHRCPNIKVALGTGHHWLEEALRAAGYGFARTSESVVAARGAEAIAAAALEPPP